MSEDDFVADKLLRCLPVALDHRSREPFLVYLAAAQVNIFGVVHVAKDIGEKHFVGFDRFVLVVGNRSVDEAGDIHGIGGLTGFRGAGGNVGGAFFDITRRAAGREQHPFAELAAELKHERLRRHDKARNIGNILGGAGDNRIEPFGDNPLFKSRNDFLIHDDNSLSRENID